MSHSPTYSSIDLLVIVSQKAVYRFGVVALVFVLYFAKEMSQRKPHILYIATFFVVVVLLLFYGHCQIIGSFRLMCMQIGCCIGRI
jgi:hypothetical protein